MTILPAAYLSPDIEAATVDLRRREISRLTRGIGDWRAGITSSAELGAIRRGDLHIVQRELVGVERRLERLTTEIILDR